MSQVSKSLHLAVPADKVWELIGSFNALPDWHPAVQSSSLEDGGKHRRLALVGGGEIVERLEQLDDDGRLYRYSIVESPLPVSNYSSELRVVPDPDGSGCTVEWTGDFEAFNASASDAEKAIHGVYKLGLENLQKMFGMK